MSSPVRPDWTMTLLTSVQEHPLEPGYAEAAARREHAGRPRRGSVRSPLLFLSCVLVGLVLAIGAVTLRQSVTNSGKVRADLVERIETRRAEADRYAAQIAASEQQIAALEKSALERADEGGLADRVAALRLALGAEAVSGPGLVVTLDDSADATGDAGNGQGKVLARDVATVVNALWAAGAEAIAVNDQRLSARSAIRFAGDAILVNYRPLVPPYRISAIGDPQQLPTRFAEGAGAAYLKALSDNFQVQTDVADASRLTLPRAAGLDVHVATAPGKTS